MKRLIILCMMVIMCGCFLVGCGGDSGKKEVDVNTLAEELKNGITYDDDLVDTTTEMMCRMFNVSKDYIAEQKTYNNSGASAELISVIKCKSKEAAQIVKPALIAYAAERKQMYASYNPTEANKLGNAVIEVIDGNYVVICVSGNAAKAKEIISK